jgi:hypothetical protein
LRQIIRIVYEQSGGNWDSATHELLEQFKEHAETQTLFDRLWSETNELVNYLKIKQEHYE